MKRILYHISLLASLLLLASSDISAQIIINEFSAANRTVLIDNFGRAEDWIELHNLGSAPVNLGGYHLSDKLNNPTKWAIPAGVVIGPGEYLIALASKRDQFSGGFLHTNFNITQTQNNEYVILADPSGNILDAFHVDIPNQTNHSYGRQSDGALNWVIFPNPTPGAPNGGAFFSSYASTPSMSMPAGFYDEQITVTLSSNQPDVSIRYTLDGSDPTPTSPLYSNPLIIDETIVLRCRAYSSNNTVLPGLINTRTYFIHDNSTLPVVSIAGNQIMTLMNGSQIEPVGTFELFDKAGERQAYAVGEFDKHGNDSWGYAQRGIDYTTRDQFGYDYALRHQIFPNKTRDRYQRVMLKAAANDNYPFSGGAHIRDAYIQTLSQHAGLELDERTNLPCLLFVNGEYWGVYEIREKVDDPDFTEYYYGQNRLNIDFIKTWGGTWFEYNSGTAGEWYPLHDFITNNDMTDPANYNYVQSQLNVLSLIDYMIINTHAVCMDWLNWNTAWWRGRYPQGDALTWRYTLWDMDASFGHYINYTGIPNTGPTASPCDNEIYQPWSDPQGHVDLIISLMENETFHSLYVNRYADLLNSYLSCDYMIELLDDMIGEIAPEMPRQIDRWGGNINAWQNAVNALRNFILARCAVLNDGIVDCYDVEGPYPFQVIIEPENTDNKVRVNTITPNTFPFEGEYFGGVTMNLQAQAAPGWIFQNWSVANNSFGPSQFNIAIQLAMQTGDTVIAYFVPAIPCATPAEATQLDSTLSTATFSWDGPGNSLSYEVKYRPSGSAQNWSVFSTQSTEFTAWGLSPCTTYEVEIRAICQIATSDFYQFNIHTDCNQTTSTSSVPKSLLSSVWPNPFVDRFSLQVQLPQSQRLQLELLDLNGKRILYREVEASPGQQTFEFQTPQGLPSGIYFLRVQSDTGASQVHRVVRAE
jgi:hypothetical protein